MDVIMLYMVMTSRLIVAAKTAIDMSRLQAVFWSSNGRQEYQLLIWSDACSYVQEGISSDH